MANSPPNKPSLTQTPITGRHPVLAPNGGDNLEGNDTMQDIKTNDALIAALLEAQKNITHANKNGKNPYFTSDYATLEEVITTVKGPLNKEGVFFQQISHASDYGVSVETIFYGHGSSLPTGPFNVPTDKRDPQGYGSALTYAKRYSLSMACGIGHQKDDDAESAMIDRKKSDPVYSAPQRTFAQDSAGTQAAKAMTAHVDTKTIYKIMSGDQMIEASTGESDFLTQCRKHLGVPNTMACKDIYNSETKDHIKAALWQSTDGSQIKNSFQQLINLYEKAVPL